MQIIHTVFNCEAACGCARTSHLRRPSSSLIFLKNCIVQRIHGSKMANCAFIIDSVCNICLYCRHICSLQNHYFT